MNYKSGNLEVKHDKIYSYGVFMGVVKSDRLLILKNARSSPTTRRHINKVAKEAGVTIIKQVDKIL